MFARCGAECMNALVQARGREPVPTFSAMRRQQHSEENVAVWNSRSLGRHGAREWARAAAVRSRADVRAAGSPWAGPGVVDLGDQPRLAGGGGRRRASADEAGQRRASRPAASTAGRRAATAHAMVLRQGTGPPRAASMLPRRAARAIRDSPQDTPSPAYGRSPAASRWRVLPEYHLRTPDTALTQTVTRFRRCARGSDLERSLLVRRAQHDRRAGRHVRLGPDPGQQGLQVGRGARPGP